MASESEADGVCRRTRLSESESALFSCGCLFCLQEFLIGLEKMVMEEYCEDEEVRGLCEGGVV